MIQLNKGGVNFVVNNSTPELDNFWTHIYESQ